MIKYLKKYWKYILVFCSLIIVFTFSFFIYSKDTKVEAKVENKSNGLEKEEEKTEIIKTVFVDVKGYVNTPGVYEMDENKRIIDAINVAGGLSEQADTSNLNLSMKLKDEMYIVIYSKSELYNYKKNNEKTCPSFECICPDSNNDACIAKDFNNSSSNSSKISINTGSKEQLMTLSGIGESKANAIISYREETGDFKKIEDIKEVPGIGESMYEKIKDNITI